MECGHNRHDTDAAEGYLQRARDLDAAAASAIRWLLKGLRERTAGVTVPQFEVFRKAER